MLIPAEKIVTASFKNPQANSLHLATDRQPTLFWIFSAEDQTMAIFLSGPYAQHGFEISEGAPWSGVSIGPVEVRIDPGSAGDADDRSRWQLKGTGGALHVQAIMKLQGFDQAVWLPVGDFTTIDHFTVYFSRWALGMQVDDEWTELVSFADGKVQGPLVPRAE